MVDGRKLRKTRLWHLSWWRVLTEAIVQQRYRGISDTDQEWILRELIHYLSSPASGAVGFEDMGENWVTVRKAAHDGTLRVSDPAVRDVAERWEQFTHYLGLSLSQELGASVTAHRPRGQATPARLDEIGKSLADTGELHATLRIPGAVGPLEIRADLRPRQTFTSVSIDAPREGRQKSRFSWLLRQLRDAADDLRVEASFPNARSTTASTLAKAREDPSVLHCAADPKREPRSFVLTSARPMGQKRGRAEGSFVRETSAQAVEFYRDLVQTLRPWQAPALRLRAELEDADGGDGHVPVVPTWVGEERIQPGGPAFAAAPGSGI